MVIEKCESIEEKVNQFTIPAYAFVLKKRTFSIETLSVRELIPI